MSKALLLYDGECPICLRARDWIDRHRMPEKLELMPCQDEARPQRAPQVAYEDCMEAMQLVLADGTVYSGADAFEHLFPLLKRWRWLVFLFKIPGVSLIARPVYRWIARNRLGLSGLFIRKEPESCPIDPASKDQQ